MLKGRATWPGATCTRSTWRWAANGDVTPRRATRWDAALRCVMRPDAEGRSS